SYTALRVPGTRAATACTADPSASSRAGVGATIRIPTGVRTPVAIMSMRARTGAVQAFVQPGTRVLLSRLSISSAVVIGRLSGQMSPSARLTGRGAQPEYHRFISTRGHSARGLGRTVVSSIDSVAGSVAVSVAPLHRYTTSI